jgi:hypothetical protein
VGLTRNLLLAFLVAAGLSAMPNSRARANTAAVSEQQARKLAERAFLEETKQQVLTYSVERLKETPSPWRFLVQGTGNFARPGI